MKNKFFAKSGTKKEPTARRTQKSTIAKGTGAKLRMGKTKQKSLTQIGFEGEQRIYNSLVQIFGSNLVFRNVYIRRPSGRLTEIDLLAVNSTGLYVVESKNYAGKVCGDGRCTDWLHVKNANYKRIFYSPVAQNKGHIDALREACMRYIGYVPPMLSVLVFPDKCDLQVVHLPIGLRCCKLSQLPIVLSNVFKQASPALRATQVADLAGMFNLSQRHMLPPEIPAQHMRDVAAVKSWAKRNKG